MSQDTAGILARKLALELKGWCFIVQPFGYSVDVNDLDQAVIGYAQRASWDGEGWPRLVRTGGHMANYRRAQRGEQPQFRVLELVCLDCETWDKDHPETT